MDSDLACTVVNHVVVALDVAQDQGRGVRRSASGNTAESSVSGEVSRRVGVAA
jgi:hypothetical protein